MAYHHAMPKLTIESLGAFEIPQGKRLINAIIDDARANQHYSCGGNAKCTTCRVQFVAGEPEAMTQAEKDLLIASKIDLNAGTRLSCQMQCTHDMTIQIISEKPAHKNPAHPSEEITPPAVWTTK